MQNTNWHLSVQQNAGGRDFIVGDLHGEVSLLRKALDTLQFDEKQDRLFALGDLIDRGENSFEMLQYLKQPWFFSCLGNHESMLLDYIQNPYQGTKSLWVGNGGHWYFSLTPTQAEIANQLVIEKPYWAITLETCQYKIGLIHADLPSPCHWSQFIEGLPSNMVRQHTCLWERYRAQGLAKDDVMDVDLVFMGHTVMSSATQFGNCWFIDTGACIPKRYIKEPALTLVQVQPELQFFRFYPDA